MDRRLERREMKSSMSDAAGFHVTGLPAILIILVLLALLVVGVVSVAKALGRKDRR